MPKWKARDPNLYPILFFDTVEQANFAGEPVLLKQLNTWAETDAFMERFREWRMCLRKWPGCRCKDIEENSMIKTKAISDPVTGGYSVFVQVKSRLLHSIARHNPRLWASLGADCGREH